MRFVALKKGKIVTWAFHPTVQETGRHDRAAILHRKQSEAAIGYFGNASPMQGVRLGSGPINPAPSARDQFLPRPV